MDEHEAEEFMAQTCEDCGKPNAGHSFTDMLLCAYGGEPTKAGHAFGKEDARAVVGRVVSRLKVQ